MTSRSRHPWILFVPAAAVVGLGAFVVARLLWAEAPALPRFEREPAPRFEPLEGWAERPPGGPSLRGRVLDPQGAAVADCLVYARPSEVPTWDVTDVEGRFELAWPATPAGASGGGEELEVELVLAAWGFPPATRQVSFAAEGLELRLPAREEPTPRLPEVESTALYGRIVPALARRPGEPPDFELWLEPVDPPEVLSGAVSRRVRGSSDASWRFEDLAHGRYRAHVLPGWAAGGSWPDLLAPAVAGIEHPSGTLGELVLELADGALGGQLVDGEGAPLEGALALLADAGHPERLWPPRVTDAAGRFRFGDLPAGVYRVLVAAGEARHEELAVTVAAGSEVQVELPPLMLRKPR